MRTMFFVASIWIAVSIACAIWLYRLKPRSLHRAHKHDASLLGWSAPKSARIRDMETGRMGF